MLREKIRFNGEDKSIKISINGGIDYTGEQESINSFVEEATGASINDIDDGEKYPFNPVDLDRYDFVFYENNSTTDRLSGIGFTEDEIRNNDEGLIKSFFLVQVYDSINSENQNLLHSGYFNGYDFINYLSTTSGQDYADRTVFLNLPTDIDFQTWYIPSNFLNSFTSNTITLYARFYFYNAKVGELRTFINNDNINFTNENKIYEPFIIYKDTTRFDLSSGFIVNCRETENTDYKNKINETIESFSVEKPVYPDKQFFNEDGDYGDI